MQTDSPVFVFVHGFWHGAKSWDQVALGIEDAGFIAHSLDLPGAGEYAKFPHSFNSQPFDARAYSIEPSPNANVTQAERTNAVIQMIMSIDRPVILVGHSMGGATISDVAEQVPERIKAVIYVAAFMLRPGLEPLTLIRHDSMKGSIVPTLYMAEPTKVGALRVRLSDEDPDYRERVREAFFPEMSNEEIARMISHTHCDEPAQVLSHPSAVTAERFGKIERHYIRCLNDRCALIAGQDAMIDSMDEAMGNKTVTHALPAGHMPLYSHPQELVDILSTVAMAKR